MPECPATETQVQGNTPCWRNSLDELSRSAGKDLPRVQGGEHFMWT